MFQTPRDQRSPSSLRKSGELASHLRVSCCRGPCSRKLLQPADLGPRSLSVSSVQVSQIPKRCPNKHLKAFRRADLLRKRGDAAKGWCVWPKPDFGTAWASLATPTMCYVNLACSELIYAGFGWIWMDLDGFGLSTHSQLYALSRRKAPTASAPQMTIP